MRFRWFPGKLLRSTGFGRPLYPPDHARSAPQTVRSSRAAFAKCRRRGGLPSAVPRRSLRFGSVPSSLRLRSTFPFAEPQTEANSTSFLCISHWSQLAILTNPSFLFRLVMLREIKKLESVKTPANTENELAIISFQP